MATRGDAGDAPVLKLAPLPSGEGKVYSEGFNSSARGDPKAKAASYTGVDPEIQSGVEAKIPSSKYAGVGPMLAAGVYLRPAAGSFAGVDHMAVAGYFSSLYPMALAGDTKLNTFKPPMPRSEPIILHSPREHIRIIALKNYIKRANLLRLEKRERLVMKREDRAERHDQRVEQREIRADQKEAINHSTALGLEQKRKKIEEDQEQASLALQQDRKKFEEDTKAAFLALEEERRKFEEYKLQVSQQAGEKGEASVDKKDKGQASLVVSKVETADSRLALLEKLIDIPKRKQAIGKSISENAEIVKKLIQPNAKKIRKFLTAATTTGVLGMLRGEIRELIGLPAGVSNGDLKVSAANGTGNGAASTEAGSGAASTGAGSGAASTGAGSGAASTGAGAGAASTGAGSGAASTGAGSGAASTAAGSGAASTGAGVKAV